MKWVLMCMDISTQSCEDKDDILVFLSIKKKDQKTYLHNLIY